jgi:hypothetical protein
MTNIYIDDDTTTATFPAGVFGPEHREVHVARRYVNGYVQTAYVARANPMEGPAGNEWIAWVEDNYSGHFVSVDKYAAASVVLNDVYGRPGY